MERISVDITVEYAEVLSLERACSMVTRVNDVPVGCRVLDQTKVDGECLIWWSPLVGMSPNFLFDQDYQSAETESDADQSIDSCPHPPDQKDAHATTGCIPPGAIDTSVHCPYARDSVLLDGLFPSTGPEKDFDLKSHEALTKEFMNAPYHDEQLIRRSLVLSDCDFNRKGMKSPSREASCQSAAEKEPALLSQPSSPDDSPAS
ncbi:hypothetical protein AAWM_08735 [Aspergillus awamori]|uniref:Uncharacterized protein n=1 Tax=Aspergillus awamori TaxID=105351 RepID=A0A401L2V2_ASPAW|nr:hypothetical protein AAWM_08735 [Aspergillus awamori]